MLQDKKVRKLQWMQSSAEQPKCVSFPQEGGLLIVGPSIKPWK